MSLVGACAEPSPDVGEEEQDIYLEEFLDEIPNNLPLPNSRGLAASWSPEGHVNLAGEFFQAQGTNGRHCGSCHAPEDGWSINPGTVSTLFLLTGGTHPIFNVIDADRPDADVSTVSARWKNYSMLRQGKFIRLVSPPAVRDYTVTAANDPFGFGTTARLMFFRRPLPTSNFKGPTVMWDAANTVATGLRDGLIRQARGNVTGAQQGPAASDEVIFEIVDYEASMAHAQLVVPGVGRLDADGATGGPEAQVSQALVAGRFDLFDAWATSGNPRSRLIARGQELFNTGDANGRSCGGCHNAANNGQNVTGRLFDVGASRPEFAKPDMAVYTFQRNLDGATVQSTDPGRGIRNGVFADLNKFKTPNIRGLAARAPYFHNGIADSLPALVDHYEAALGFNFTDAEEADLVAFLGAL